MYNHQNTHSFFRRRSLRSGFPHGAHWQTDRSRLDCWRNFLVYYDSFRKTRYKCTKRQSLFAERRFAARFRCWRFFADLSSFFREKDGTRIARNRRNEPPNRQKQQLTQKKSYYLPFFPKIVDHRLLHAQKLFLFKNFGIII
ncbi:unnamed protein product [Oikopleura dioica]|uniref:Uncharacterized protein n=1 Tax=Oikopleura dioica TaxID=34765 RepID=E4XWE9_OIKDI|nr:unnamed protein product [Oikopleura dioica]